MLHCHSAGLGHRVSVGATTTLGLAGDDTARSYMEHILSRVKPLLEQRHWFVCRLCEFYPRSTRLLGLNVNKGEEIRVRFRVPGDKSRFLPFTEVMGTVLHELAHCEVSGHDKTFWSLYYYLVSECEALEVAMIAEGQPLYPVTPQAMQSWTTNTNLQLPATAQRVAAALANHSNNPSHRRSGGRTTRSAMRRSSASSGAGAGRATRQRAAAGSRVITLPAPVVPRNHTKSSGGEKSLNTSTAARRGPTRAAEGGVRGATAPLAPPTPTREQLRRLLAEKAAERIQQQKQQPHEKEEEEEEEGQGEPEVASTSVRSEWETPSVVSSAPVEDGTPEQERDPRLERLLSIHTLNNHSEEADKNHFASNAFPDEIPRSTHEGVSGNWMCPACHYCNSPESAACEVCSEEVEEPLEQNHSRFPHVTEEHWLDGETTVSRLRSAAETRKRSREKDEAEDDHHRRERSVEELIVVSEESNEASPHSQEGVRQSSRSSLVSPPPHETRRKAEVIDVLSSSDEE